MEISEFQDAGAIAIAPKANAFRVLDDGNGLTCFLDFLDYDPVKDKALVVSRIKISRGFLPAIRDKLNLTLQDKTGTLAPEV